MGSEMLVPDERLSGRSPFPASALMMALDHSCIPAVVLIVEDEMMLRMRAVDMVEDAGYTPSRRWMPPKPSPSWNPDPRRADVHRYPDAGPNGRRGTCACRA